MRFPLLACLIFLPYLRLAVAFSQLDPWDIEGELGRLQSRQTRAELTLPINPYTPNVKLKLCSSPEEQEQSKLLIAELITNDVAAAKIEIFDVEYFCVYEHEGGCGCGDLLSPFTELIGRGGSYLKALKQLRWSSSRFVYPPLLTSLEEHFPNLELNVDLPWGDPAPLRSSPLMHSLHVHFEPHKLDTTKTSPLLTHAQKQIMDSPNLVELSMKIGSLGCVIYDVDPKFARLRGRRFPPLEKLTLEAFPLTVKNVDYWMNTMDWSQMGNLDLRAIYKPTYFLNKSMELADGLPQLKTLRIELPWFYEVKNAREFEDTFRRFLDAPRDTGLSGIALEGEYQPYLEAILDGHGATLKSLLLHDPERPFEPQREMLSELDLSDIGRRAPNLEGISVDINRTPNGTLPIEFLDALLSETAFPSLQTIELFGILGVSDEYPVSNWSHGLTDQRPLLSKLTSRTSINRVQIHMGENRRLSGGYPADWVLWEQDHQELWVAERDASGKIAVRVTRGGIRSPFPKTADICESLSIPIAQGAVRP